MDLSTPPVVEASGFAPAAQAAQGYSEIGKSILANNPYMQRIQGYIAAKNLAIAQGQLNVAKQQADTEATRVSNLNAFQTGQLAETVHKDQMDATYNQDMLGYQQKALDDQIATHANQYSIDLAKNALDARGQDLQKQIADTQAKIDMSKNDIEKQQLTAQINYQNQQLQQNQQQLDTAKATSDSEILKNNSEINFQHYQLNAMQQGGYSTLDQMNAQAKNDSDLVKDAQVKAEAASAILPKVQQFQKDLAAVPYTGKGGSLVEAGYGVASIGSSSASDKFSAYERLNDNASALITFLKADTPGRLNDNLMDLLHAQTGGASTTEETNQYIAQAVQSKVTYLQQYPSFVANYKVQYKNLNDMPQAWNDYTQLTAVQNGQAHIPGDNEYKSFIENYGQYQQEAAQMGVSTINYLQTIGMGK